MNVRPWLIIILLIMVGIMVGGVQTISLASPPQLSEDYDFAKIGVFIGTNTLIGANYDWYFPKYQLSVDSTLYYRVSSVPGDYILGSDVKLKRYAGKIENNKWILFEGLGIGYASLQNMKYVKSFTGLYYDHEKDNYIYILGSLGSVYFGDRYNYYIEFQPVASKNTVTLLSKIGIYV